MLKFPKMTVAEDVITTEEVLVVVSAEVDLAAEEEKEALHQDAKVHLEALEAIEIQLQEKVVSKAKEALLQEKVVSEEEALQEEKVLLIEHQDALKALVMHQDQEDQEETNHLIILKCKIPNSRYVWNLGFFYIAI